VIRLTGRYTLTAFAPVAYFAIGFEKAEIETLKKSV